MPTLPNVEQAVIEIEKLRDYVLNENHPVGKHKALIFKKILNFSKDDAEELRDLILKEAQTSEAIIKHKDEYGQRYAVDLELMAENGLVIIRTGWIIKTKENFPCLTSCFIKSK